MSFSFFNRRRKRKCSWRELLTARGRDLWSVRETVLSPDGTALLDVMNTDPSWRSSSNGQGSVLVVSSISEFQKLEQEQGVDKAPLQSQQHNHDTDDEAPPRPLTRCTGEKWRRKRQLIQQVAFQNILEMSLKAVEPIQFHSLIPDDESGHQTSTLITVDLKEVVLDASLDWVVRLFRGKEDQRLRNACFEFWKNIRALNKDSNHTKESNLTLTDSFVWDGGILHELLQAGLTPKEASDNAVNAMIAALDAVQSIVFWTLWNMARLKDAWKTYRLEVSEDKEETLENDLSGLASLKKRATQGEPIDLSELSYLGRALAETVRVFPPIWTLPRTCPRNRQDVLATKFDIPTANSALKLDWDPNRKGNVYINSFGLGKRHCPAGTAALYAAYIILRKFIATFEGAKECETDKALQNVYLAPTLCVEGPQFFQLEVANGFPKCK